MQWEGEAPPDPIQGVLNNVAKRFGLFTVAMNHSGGKVQGFTVTIHDAKTSREDLEREIRRALGTRGLR